MPHPRSLEQTRWAGLWSRVGAQGDGFSILTSLDAAYAGPGRAYHTAEHIRDCLDQFDRCRYTAERPDEIEAAIWFHDAVYRPGASDNEDRSAQLARTILTDAGAPLAVAHRIAELVLATRHLSISGEPDVALLCDIDLSILGRTPDVFDEFEQRIRREYAWVPGSVYRRARTEILGGFLARRSIYQTDFFRDRYEEQARANLMHLIAELGRHDHERPVQ